MGLLGFPNSGLGAVSLPPISSLVSNVTMRSQVTPEYVWTPSSETKAQGGLTGLIMGFIRPAIYVKTPAGTMKMEPYGVPTTNYFPLLAIATVCAGLTGAWMLVSIGKRIAKRA